MDKKCIGCLDRSESIRKNADWCLCLDKEIINKYNRDKGTMDRIPSCMYARTYYCNKVGGGKDA
ncbi:MAG: hypothetical protein WC365_00610 [Candidatus Babeliales bacterium]|jgi:hypothetical protein